MLVAENHCDGIKEWKKLKNIFLFYAQLIKGVLKKLVEAVSDIHITKPGVSACSF